MNYYKFEIFIILLYFYVYFYKKNLGKSLMLNSICHCVLKTPLSVMKLPGFYKF